MGVLVIDPNEVDQKIVCELLNQWGYHDIHAFTSIHAAEEALTLNSEHSLKSVFGIDSSKNSGNLISTRMFQF